MTDFPEELHPRYRYFEKARNTFLYVHLRHLARSVDPQCWEKLVKPSESCKAPSTLHGKLWNRLKRLLGMSVGDIANWAHQSIGSHYTPENYVVLDPSSHVLIEEVANRASAVDVPILDLGCNCGRHLNALMNLGFKELYGVDIGRKALDYMDEVFPGLSNHAKITCASFQQYLLKAPDQFFDVLYTKGATVELIHPSFPLVSQLARVSRRYVILCIQENSHSYPRYWTYEFQRAGFVLVKLLRPAVEPAARKSPSLLVYRRCIPDASQISA